MAVHREVFTLDISQVEAGLRRLSALQNQLLGAANAPINLPNIAPPNFAAQLGSLSPDKQLAQIARLQAALDTSVAKAQAAGAINQGQAAQLQGVIAGLGGGAIPTAAQFRANPALNIINPATGLPFTAGAIGEAARQRSYAQGTVNRVGVYGQEDLARVEAAAARAARKNLVTEEQIAGVKDSELASQQAIAAAQARRAQQLRTRVAVLEGELGRTLTDTSDYSLQRLAAAEAALRAERQLVNLGTHNATIAGANAARLYNPAALRADAAAEAQINAQNRAIAAAYGAAKQQALYMQIQANQSVRADVGREDALRKARLGIEQQLLQQQLSRGTGIYNVATRRQRTLRDDVVGGQVAERRGAAIEGALLQQTLAADNVYIQNKVRTARALAQEEAAKALTLANDQQYIAAKAASARASVLESLALIRNTTQSDIINKGRLAAETKVIGDRVKVAELEALSSQQALQAKAQRIIAERNYAAVLRKSLSAELAAQGAPALSRLQARYGGGGFGGGGGFAGGGGAGQFFGGGLLTSLRYALPSLAFFGGISFIGNTIKEAEELQRNLTVLRGQIEEAFVDNPQKGEEAFNSMKNTILEAARATGIEADKLTDAASQIQGAFADITFQLPGGDLGGQALAEAQTVAASQIALVSGLDLQEVTDSITAASLAFKRPAEDIGNVAVRLRTEFGVLEKETIKFLGDVAPVAEEAGFSLEEFATIAAKTQQRSGLSGGDLAERFGRAIPAITKNKEELIKLSQLVEGLDNEEFLGAVAGGDIREVVFGIAEQFPNMNRQAKEITYNLFGRREAQSFLGALSDSESVLRTINELEQSAGGELDRKAALLAETLSTEFKRLGEQVRQLGVAVYEAGLGDVLEGVIDLLQLAVTLVSAFANAWNTVDDALGGIPSEILKIYLLLKAVSALGIVTGVQNIAGGALAALMGRSAFTRAAPGALTAAQLAAINANLATYGTAGAGTGAAGAAGAGAAGAGAGAGAAAGLLPYFLVGAAGIGATGAFYNKYNSDLEGAEQGLSEKLRGLSDERLRQLANDTNGLFERAGARLFGVDLPNILAQEELFRRQSLPGTDFLNAAIEQQLFEPYIDEVEQIVEDIRGRGEVVTLESFLNQRGINDFGLIVDRQVTKGKGGLEGPGRLDLSKLTPEKYQEIVAAAEGGSQAAAGIIFQLGELYAAESTVAGIQIKDAQERANAYNDAIQKVEETTLTLDAAKTAYDVGAIGLGEYLRAKDRYIGSLKEAIENAEQADPALIASLKKEQAERAAIYADARQSQIELQTEINTLRYGETGSLSRSVDLNVAQLNNPQFTDRESRLEVARSIIELRTSMRDAALEEFDTAAEQLAFIQANPIEIDPEVRLAFLRGQLNENNTSWQNFLSSFKVAFSTTGEEMVDEYLVAIAMGERTIDDVKAEIQRKIEGLLAAQRRTGEDLGTGLNAYDELIGTLNRLNDPGTVVAEDPAEQRRLAEEAEREAEQAAEDAKREAEEARNAAISARNAEFEYYKALYGEDPVALSNIVMQQAQFQLSVASTPEEWYAAQASIINAQRQQRDAVLDIQRARMEYQAALVSGDPVKAAQEAVRLAEFEIANATNEADRIRAEAEKISADRALQDAIRAVVDAQAGLLIAIAQAAGDTVEVARIELAEAQRKVLEAQAKYEAGEIGQVDLINAQTELIRAQAGVRDARLQEELEQYQFLYDMGRITKSQFVAYLEQLKQIPELTEDQIRDLDRQIKQLRGELAQDFQFNLPTNLGLPTLYEVNRLSQSGFQQGSFQNAGYQDNRQVSINVTVNNQADQQTVINAIDAALGQPRVGTVRRSY